MNNSRSPVVRGPDDGEKFYAVGDLYRFLAVKEDTDGSYAIWEATVPPGGGPPPHLHHREEEGFYVIEGRVTFYHEGNEIEATPGSYLNLPKESKHWFRNNSDANAKMLILVAPGGMEEMFKETGTPVTDATAPPPPFGDEEKQRIIQAAPKYGVEIFPPGQ